MEHVPLPSGVALDINDSVQLFVEEEYDRGLFLDYPTRTKTIPDQLSAMLSSLRPDQLVYQFEPMPSFAPEFDIRPFLQNWLFFGLLHEFLGTDFRTEDFIVCKSADANESGEALQHGHCVSTTTLSNITSRKILKMQHMEDLEQFLAHISLCIWVAGTALTALTTSMEENGRSEEVNLVLSIGAAAEHLRQCLVNLATISNLQDPIQYLTHQNEKPDWMTENSMTILQDRMVLRNWCPRTAKAMLEKAWFSLPTQIYLSHLVLGTSAYDHAKCSLTSCLAHDIEKSLYRTRHRHESCDCIFVGPSVSDLRRILGSGTFPLVKLTKNPETGYASIEAVPYETGQVFVAISHVWADGLGNPDNNTLPVCQLEHLTRVSKDLGVEVANRDSNPMNHLPGACTRWQNRHPSARSQVVEYPGGQHVCSFKSRQDMRFGNFAQGLFWIDTLCCPVHDNFYRKIALQRILAVYNDASIVLVLDSTFSTVIARNMDEIELLARILSSGWATRLWTLQEGSLSTDLWFQFEDCAIDLLSTWLSPKEFDTMDHVMMHDELKRTVFDLRVRELLDEESALHDVKKATYGRKVNRPDDEPFCLATLLDLDTTAIIECDEQEMKICAFWQAISDRGMLPGNIVFAGVDTVTRKGFRWAPLSLLKSEPPSESYLIKSTLDVATIVPGGLQAHHCALSLRGSYMSHPTLDPLITMRRDDMLGNLRVGPYDWYHIVQGRPSGGSMTAKSTNLHQILNALSEGCMLLMHGSEPSLRDYAKPYRVGLLCVPMDNTRTSMGLSSIEHVTLGKPARGHNFLRELAFQVVTDYDTVGTLRDVIQKVQELEQEHHLGLMLKFVKLLRHLTAVAFQLEKFRQFLHEMKPSPPVEWYRWLHIYIHLFAVGCYIEAEATFPKSTQWIID